MMEYHLAIKKNKIMPFFFGITDCQMDLEMVILSEVNQTQKDKYHMISFICGIKEGTNELIYKTEVESQM